MRNPQSKNGNPCEGNNPLGQFGLDISPHPVAKLLQDADDVGGQIGQCLGDDVVGNAVEGLSNAAGYGGLGVGVAAGEHGVAQGLLKGVALDEAAHAPWHRLLAAGVEMAVAPYLPEGTSLKL